MELERAAEARRAVVASLVKKNLQLVEFWGKIWLNFFPGPIFLVFFMAEFFRKRTKEKPGLEFQKTALQREDECLKKKSCHDENQLRSLNKRDKL